MSPNSAPRLLLLVSLVLLAAGYGIASPPSASAVVLGSPRWPAKEGNPATDFVLESLDGDKINSSQLRGYPILIHFWASWCQPCREEVPRIEEAARKYRTSGLHILAITNDSDRRELMRFAHAKSISFPILVDPDSVVFEHYRAIGIPTSIFVDANGAIRTIVPGPMSSAELEWNLIKIVKTDSSEGNPNED